MPSRKSKLPDPSTLERWLAACEAASTRFDAAQNLWIISLRRQFDIAIQNGEKELIRERQAEILESLYQDAVGAPEPPRPVHDAPEAALPASVETRRPGGSRATDPAIPANLAPRVDTLRGSDKQRALGYEVRSFLIETLAPHLHDLTAAGELETARRVDALLVDVSSRADSKWFIERRAVLSKPLPRGKAALRRALHFANLQIADDLARDAARWIARELSVEIDIAPACQCVPSPLDCPDRRCWDIIGSPHAAWLRIHLRGDMSFDHAQLETGRRSAPLVHADIRHDGGSWSWLDGAGCEIFGLDAIREALASGELPE